MRYTMRVNNADRFAPRNRQRQRSPDSDRLCWNCQRRDENAIGRAPSPSSSRGLYAGVPGV